jgi:group I intron endonuclease
MAIPKIPFSQRGACRANSSLTEQAAMTDQALVLWHGFLCRPDNLPLPRAGLYRFTCLVNDKVYIGISQNVEKRCRRHASSYRKELKFSSALFKYGQSTFLLEPLVYSIHKTNTWLLELEAELIAEHDSTKTGYNVQEASQGVGPCGEEFKAILNRPETRAKLSAARRGKPGFFTGQRHSEEAKRKMRASHSGSLNHMTGKAHTDASKAKMSAAHAGQPSAFKGRTHTEEAKAKNRKAHLGRHHTEEVKLKISIAHTGVSSPLKGRQIPAETRSRISNTLKGRPITAETAAKIRAAKLGRKRTSSEIEHITIGQRRRRIREQNTLLWYMMFLFMCSSGKPNTHSQPTQQAPPLSPSERHP